MRKALLFDMDGTLIENAMDTFLPPYFAALTKKLSSWVPADKLVAQLNASTRAMVANNNPARTNAEVFSDDFFPKIGVARDVLMPLLNDFYSHEYCDLVVFTKPVKAAHPVLSRAFQMHHQVVIATAPLFPMVALRQRLKWGGLDDFPYAFITDYESMHACKPNPAYYQEIAARLKCTTEDCVMIGNDVQMDILPARYAGMKTFWVTDAGEMPTDVPSDWRGTLEDLNGLLESNEI